MAQPQIAFSSRRVSTTEISRGQGRRCSRSPADAPRYEYMSLNDCPQAKPDALTAEVSCAHALRDCPEGEIGRCFVLATDDYRGGSHRTLGRRAGSRVPPMWRLARPTLTMADLKAAFMRTPWSKPQVSSQPAGNTTLVNLKTFYRVNWRSKDSSPGRSTAPCSAAFPCRSAPSSSGSPTCSATARPWVPPHQPVASTPAATSRTSTGRTASTGSASTRLRGRFQPGRLHVGRDPLDRHRAGTVDGHHGS